jgi:hypothetical protein
LVKKILLKEHLTDTIGRRNNNNNMLTATFKYFKFMLCEVLREYLSFYSKPFLWECDIMTGTTSEMDRNSRC